jgi:holin-like protein
MSDIAPNTASNSLPTTGNSVNVPPPVPVDSNPPKHKEAAVTRSLAILLAFQCLGEAISRGTGVPIPGPVIGMVLFLCLLSAAPSVTQHVEYVSRGLLNHLSLLFVPAGVGVMVFADQMNGQVIIIALALVASTILSIAVAALVTGTLMTMLDRKKARLQGSKANRA